MPLAIIYSRASCGINAPLVTVETHISYGMAGFCIVGLPEAAVKESRDRVRSAIINSRFEFPAKRITVNLAPADLPKEGGRFDLPIALGILAASSQLPLQVFADLELTGELALSGELRPVRGILPVVLAASQSGRTLIVPHLNAEEAALATHAHVLSAKHLLDVCTHLTGGQTLVPCAAKKVLTKTSTIDISDVKGQVHAKRALTIAAAGKHSLLYIGPPGTGKTMLASRLTTLLPELTETEAMEVAAIASVSHTGFDPSTWKHIPYRSPHHTSSNIALVGGGRSPRPGEISLAHKGVLFLDELPEFQRQVLECLREPLESGTITISRAAFQTLFPAEFQLIAAMNPCPCGYAGSSLDTCQCSSDQIKRYMSKISGPLLDRIDMQVEVARLSPTFLAASNHEPVLSSADVKAKVLTARHFQLSRQGKCNVALSVPELDRHANLDQNAIDCLNQVITKFNLSARAYHRIIKVARTIADLENSEGIQELHLGEALNYRCLDRLRL